MSNKPKIILLCGGKGERLKPLTIDIPKPLIQINKKPIISYIFEHLESFKLDEFIITTGYKADKIDFYMKELKPSFSYKTVNSGETDIIQRIKDSSKYIDVPTTYLRSWFYKRLIEKRSKWKKMNIKKLSLALAVSSAMLVSTGAYAGVKAISGIVSIR